MTKSEVPFFTTKQQNNINNAFKARLEILFVYFYNN